MKKEERKKALLVFTMSVALAAAFLLSFPLSAAAQMRPEIRVRAEAAVETDVITLGQIAQISGEAAKARQLEKVSLGYAPGVGLLREISRQQILVAVAAAGFAEGQFSLESPPKVIIRRAGQAVTRDEIREAVERVVLQQFAADAVAAAIVRLEAPESVLVPTGRAEVRIGAFQVRSLFSRFSVPVEIRVDEKTVRRLPVVVEIEAFADILVAAKDLPAGAAITAADVRLEKRRLDRPVSSYLRDAVRLRGAVLIKPLAGGAAVTSDSFAAGLVVRAGDALRIEAHSGTLKIIVQGEARSSGRIGDRISVKNTQSGAVLQAVIVEAGLVRVNF